jgi:hypothetical protein
MSNQSISNASNAVHVARARAALASRNRAIAHAANRGPSKLGPGDGGNSLRPRTGANRNRIVPSSTSSSITTSSSLQQHSNATSSSHAMAVDENSQPVASSKKVGDVNAAMKMQHSAQAPLSTSKRTVMGPPSSVSIMKNPPMRFGPSPKPGSNAAINSASMSSTKTKRPSSVNSNYSNASYSGSFAVVSRVKSSTQVTSAASSSRKKVSNTTTKSVIKSSSTSSSFTNAVQKNHHVHQTTQNHYHHHHHNPPHHLHRHHQIETQDMDTTMDSGVGMMDLDDALEVIDNIKHLQLQEQQHFIPVVAPENVSLVTRLNPWHDEFDADPLLVNEYADEIFEYMKEMEVRLFLIL